MKDLSMLLPRVTREVAEALVLLKVPEGRLALRVDPSAHLPWGAVVHSILVAAIHSVALLAAALSTVASPVAMAGAAEAVAKNQG
jgi:hypothetical protein